MDGYNTFLVFLSGYIAILIAVGWYFSKHQHSPAQFWLAGKGVGTLSIGFSAAASWLTAGALLAVIGFFMLLGMGSVWGFVAPNVIALAVIAFFVKKIKNLPAITQPELLELRYGSHLRTPVALIITIVMILFAVADIKGFAMVLQVFYGIAPLHAALIVGLAVAVYVTLGGLSAVIATDMIQFLFLFFFILAMAGLVLVGAGNASGLDLSAMVASAPASWFNPLSIGLPMVLIFVCAIVPGWITEQDPWQRVWAAKDVASARNGMLVGAVLVAVVFAACLFIALGLNTLYPEIARNGFPMGMAQAEPALLNFIMATDISGPGLALCALCLATAAMSCTDTFAASGASCISRDIYQRCLNPRATLRETARVNRISVIFMVICATAGSFFIDSIIDAIHIATFIASAAYFFVLMGGIYWKRGTAQGATASLYTGFIVQVGLVVLDLVNTAPAAPPFLESIHPVLMGHGVIPAMAASGLVYVLVSLSTPSAPRFRLAPFFPEEARQLATALEMPKKTDRPVPEDIECRHQGSRVQLGLTVAATGGLSWESFVSRLDPDGRTWVALTGPGAVHRMTGPDVLSWVAVTPGMDAHTLRLETESPAADVEQAKERMGMVHGEVRQALETSRF